ncbi:MAG: TauD/TfdA family dioxygenase [Proteobacteria bacterium]|nr:TauD/TfdA family dioxygenase [Pseudomonadota bacterium]
MNGATATALSDSVLDAVIPAPGAWRRADLRTEDYLETLSPACLDEIRRAADAIARFPLPTVLLDPADFELAHCRAAMTRVRALLDGGARFALVDRLPLEALSAEAVTAIYWLLSSLVARPVAQKLDGTMIYDVHDTGAAALPGSGVRPDKTNIELKPHNDNSYNTTPPDYVALLCVRPARRGGRSLVTSFLTFSAHQINGGYALKGEPIDAAGTAAIAALLDMFADPALTIEFDLAPGHLQFVNNRAIGHSRTAFEDFPEPERRRHLVRLWLRDHGRRAYPG